MADKNNNLHVCNLEKFIPPFIEFIRHNIHHSDNFFYTTGNLERFPYRQGDDSHHQPHGVGYLALLRRMYASDKIILHGLFDTRVVALLYFNPWLLKKCYWVLWGGDYFSYKLWKRTLRWRIREFFRRPVIRNIGHLITYIPGSVETVREWYNARGRYHECLAYTSNTFQEYSSKEGGNGVIDILVGNSANPSNQHFEIFEMLRPHAAENIRIHAPLSYGDEHYAEEVIIRGRALFGEKFIPLTEMIPGKEYLSFLSGIDLAIFNHNRQQAMGTTITLLGMGKKVYMRSDIASWDLLRNKGVKVYDVALFDGLNGEERLPENVAPIRRFFSRENLARQWAGILND